MKNFVLSLLLFAFFQPLYSQWQQLETGVTSDLTGVVFVGNLGIITSENDIYYTTTGGETSTDWSLLTPTSTSPDVITAYNNSVFYSCNTPQESTETNAKIFVCGKNTVTNQAVIFKITMPSLNCELIYTGTANSSLNKIRDDGSNGFCLAAGDNGLLVRINLWSNAVDTILTNTTDDFISVDMYSNYCLLISPGKLRYGSFYGYPQTMVNVLEEVVLSDVKDAMFGNSTDANLVGDNSYVKNYNGTVTYNNNFYGPLNAKSITNYYGFNYVATDHGIYRSGSSRNYLELQPSSEGMDVTEFWSGEDIYACGKDGLLLKGLNEGGATEPYVSIKTQNTCVETNALFQSFRGSSTSCQWFINGELFYTGCSNNVFHSFEEPGTYTVTLETTNDYGLSGSASKDILIVIPPLEDLPVTLQNPLLCKNEHALITIDNTQENVVYHLYKQGQIGGGTYGSVAGTGGTVVMESGTIDEAGTYYIKAKNEFAECYSNLDNTVYIDVEKTEAKMHASLINAETNEEVYFFQQAVDAQNFEWEFYPGSSVTESTEENPVTSFNAPGSTSVTLQCSSENGCEDTQTFEGPLVYTPSTVTAGWSVVNTGPQSVENTPGDFEVSDFEKTPDGLLTCGSYYNRVFGTTDGLNYDLSNKRGAYLAKHDFNGVLKWVIYTEKDPTDQGYDVIPSIATDSENNIYICGYSKGYMYDNTGTEISLKNPEYPWVNTGFIVKLDERGKFIWKLQITRAFPGDIYVDKEDNLVATGIFNYSPSMAYLNNTPVGDFGEAFADNVNFFIAKISSGGSVLWDAGVEIQAVNGEDLTDVGFDSENNIYLNGYYEQDVKLYNEDEATYIERLGLGNYGNKMFLGKYDTNGNVQWLTRSYTIINTPNMISSVVRPYDMKVDDHGNCYITGSNNAYLNTTYSGYQVFENSDATTTVQEDLGAYFVLKVNSQGNCEWMRGASYSYYGEGYQLLKDGNEISVVGTISNNDSTVPVTSTFTSNYGESYDLTLNTGEVFMATYDIYGTLLRLSKSAEDPIDSYNIGNINGFFKGDDDYFYISRNVGFYTGYNSFSFYGQTITGTNHVQATITKFNEDLGVQEFETSLCLIYPGELPDVYVECGTDPEDLTPPQVEDTCEVMVTPTLSTDVLPYPEGNATIVTWVYTNGVATVSAKQRIIVDETIAPVPDADNLADITVDCMLNAEDITAPTATDNCAGAITGTTDVEFPVTTLGNMQITWTYDDGNGNTSTQVQNVLIQDNMAPVPNLAELPVLSAECEITDIEAPTATDNCMGTITATTNNPVSYTVQGSYTITWTYDDGNGNTSTQTQSVVIDDITAPVPLEIELDDISTQCFLTDLPSPHALDNCVGYVEATTTDPLDYYEAGTYVVNWTFDDGNGNTATYTQNVIVLDNYPPSPDVVELPSITGECSVTGITPPTATDSCVGTVTATTTDPLSYNSPGTYTVNWIYDDGNGNTSTQTQQIIVINSGIVVPDLEELPNLTGECEVTNITPPTATGGCSNTINATTEDPLTYTEQGNYVITWVYDDGSGNAVTQTQNIIVDDTTPPTVITQNITVNLNGNDSVTVLPEEIDNGSNDNCSGITYFLTSDTFTEPGTYNTLLTVSDEAGNADSELAVITVVDTEMGLVDFTDDEKITLYPVPAKNWLYIEKSDNIIICSVEIFDLTGRKVYSIYGDVDKADISALSDAQYNVIINTDTATFTKAIIVQK